MILATGFDCIETVTEPKHREFHQYYQVNSNAASPNLIFVGKT